MKHPKAIYYLFFFEMWERFSYFGMRAILTLYMIQQLKLPYNTSFIIYGAFTTFVYMTSIFGGLLADKFFGHKESVKHGAILIIVGHILLSFPSIHGVSADIGLYIGLSFLSIGTGFFKPNIPVIFGNLYDKNDIRRDSGFTVFIFGINLGSLLATVSVPIVAQEFGWHYGFGLAAIGMSFGLAIFIYGDKIDVYKSNKSIDNNKNNKSPSLIYLISLTVIPALVYIFIKPNNIGYILGIVGCFYITYFLYKVKSDHSMGINDSKNIILISLICIIFFAFFEQSGSSMVMFIENFVDRKMFQFTIPIPSGSFKSLNPLFIFLLAPIFIKLWYFLNKKYENSMLLYVKFSFGLLFIGLGFGVLSLAANSITPDYKISMMWIVICYFFYTLGDLCISPIALSAMTKHAPNKYSGLMIGGFYLNIAFANYISSLIAVNVNTDPVGYSLVYKYILLICIFIFLLLLTSSILFKNKKVNS